MSIEALIAWKMAALAGWVGLLFLWERVSPAAPWPAGDGGFLPGWRRLARNGGLWVVNSALSPLIFVPVAAIAAGLGPDWRSGAEWLPGPAWMLLIDLLILDIFTYWWHRANHEVPLLWRFHRVHHYDRFLDTTSAVRFHAGEVLISAAVRGALVVALFDIPFATVVLFEGLLVASAAFHHANIALPAAFERAMARVWVTPSIHWVHHHAVRRDTDSNYCALLSVWDRVFGSASRTDRTPNMPIGLEGEGRDPSLSHLLLAPVRDPSAVPGKAPENAS